MKRLCLKDCKIDGLPLVRGAVYDIEWDDNIQSMIVYTIWGFTSLTDKEYKTIFV